MNDDLFYLSDQHSVETQISLLEHLDCDADAISLLKTVGVDVGFSILNGLLDQQLMQSPIIAFNSNMRCVPNEPGLYAIFYDGKLVYIGSCDNIRGRLREHKRSILTAVNLDIEQCSCRVLRCSKMAALSCEDHLIDFYKPAWNRSGFGSKNSALFSQSEWNRKYGRTVPLLDNSLRLRQTG